VSEGRKKEFAAFGWKPGEIPDPQNEATFARSKLKWDEIAESKHAGVLGWYRELIALRRSTPDFVNSDVKVGFSEKDKWLMLRRGNYLIAFSVAPDAVKLIVPDGTAMVLKSSDEVSLTGSELALIPDSVAILRVE
jgi:maltooligosyltrehalose trehalohydrolase